LFGLALSVVTLALTLLLTPADAVGPAWPEGIPDGAVVTHVARMFITAMLRGAVVWSVHLALYAVMFAVLGYGTVIGGFRLRRRRARAEIWRLTAISWTTLLVAMLFAAGPTSAVPDLFAPGSNWPRLLTLLNPFG
jgi:hypothetical protein